MRSLIYHGKVIAVMNGEYIINSNIWRNNTGE